MLNINRIEIFSKFRPETLFCHTLRQSENPRRKSYYVGKSNDVFFFGKHYGIKLHVEGSKWSKPEGRKNGQTIFLEMPPRETTNERCSRYVSSPEYAIENQFPPNERETKQSMWILNICFDNKPTNLASLAEISKRNTCLTRVFSIMLRCIL